MKKNGEYYATRPYNEDHEAEAATARTLHERIGSEFFQFFGVMADYYEAGAPKKWSVTA